MRYFIILLMLSTGPLIFSQQDSLYLSTEVNNVIYSTDFAISKKKLMDFMHQHKVRILNQNESKKGLTISFILDQKAYSVFDSLSASLGYPGSSKVTTTSYYTKYSENELELDYLKKKREAYAEMLQKIDEKSDNYLTLWNEQKVIEEKIFNKERELINMNNKENTYTVSLELKDESSSPENTGVKFVNMPGVEYSYLSIESPKKGISATSYQGYFLKYLFTKGKSFATLGAYKNSSINKSDTTAFSEMFVLGFGQDFYSRYLGRGSRKFLNLYSGYTLGGIMATGKNNKSNMLFVSPSVGLELFKNKYFLIDSKVNYFVPLSNNRYLRGLSYNASFNFVF